MKVGVVLNDLGASQSAFMAISFANTLLVNNLLTDITLFFCTNVPVVTRPMVAAINVDKIHQFKGLLVATDLYTASLVAKTNADKALYLWDLEWLRDRGSYIANVTLLKNSGFKLFARSEYHAKAIENYCGVVPTVLPQFNLLEMVKTYEKE